MTSETAYSTANPDAVAAYRKAKADASTQAKKIGAAVKTLGISPKVYVTSSGFSGTKTEIRSLLPNDDNFVPEGWRLSKARGVLEPRRGKPGEPARVWLAEHQPVDVRHVMEQYGLPRAAWIPGSGFGYRIVSPDLFEHDGALWACYAAEPGTSESGFDTEKCTWDRVKLSEFHAAFEAVQAADASGGDPT